ncbi:hypothetical protein L6R50_01135 [Myxococcota bacterium]|nr:hypothetical protein [Myxococcota bacterium]
MASGFALLLRPRLLQARNSLRRAEPRQRWAWAFFASLGVLAWVGMLALALWLLRSFHGVEIFGPVLVRKLLQMMLFSFFGLLVFSNVVTGISVLFLSDDMQLLGSLPIPFRRLFYARFVEAAVASSWMVFVFALPVLVAYGVVHDAGVGFYLLLPAVLAPFLAIPAALGIALAYLLVQVFPARRTKEILVAVGLVFAVAVFLGLRALRPEQLVSADAFASMADFMAAVRAPTATWLPSTWATEVLLAGLGSPADRAPLHAAALLSSGGGLVVLCRWLVTPGFSSAWTKAQEARSPKLARLRPVDAAFRFLFRPLPAPLRAMALKDARIFLRDAGQWTQVFLVASLIAVYLYNVHALPLEQFPFPSFRLENVISFLNIGVAGFVLAALSVRFNFSAVSAEGRAFWVLHASPLGPVRFLLAKFLLGAAPLVVLGEVLVVSTNLMLDTAPEVFALSAFSILGIALGVTGLAVGMGALFPDFKADNAARVAASPGAILYMGVAALFIGAVIVLQATPLVLVLTARYRLQPLTPAAWALAGVMGAASVALVVAAVAVPLRRGAAKLWDEARSGGD